MIKFAPVVKEDKLEDKNITLLTNSSTVPNLFKETFLIICFFKFLLFRDRVLFCYLVLSVVVGLWFIVISNFWV